MPIYGFIKKNVYASIVDPFLSQMDMREEVMIHFRNWSRQTYQGVKKESQNNEF